MHFNTLASQEKIVVNGKHNLCGHRKVYLCLLKEIGVQIKHCLVGEHMGLCKAVSRVLFLAEKVTF